MTVSHMYVCRQILDVSVNYQAHERNALKEKPEENLIAQYDPKDPDFAALVQAIILGTYTNFNYNPSDDECKQLYARMKNVPV
jgi:hypothetical protein